MRRSTTGLAGITLVAWLSLASLDGAESEAVGVWVGNSVCQVRESACRDESVIYTIAAEENNSGAVRVTADKVVEGKRITMGSGEYDFDAARHTLSHSDQYGSWQLSIRGDEMSGTLTLPDGTLFRRVALKKSK